MKRFRKITSWLNSLNGTSYPYAKLESNYYEPPPTISVCSISLNWSDRIRLIGVPQQLIDGLRTSLSEAWKKGIQAEREYKSSYEFKFCGNPWYGYGDESVYSRSLIIALLTFMARNGWTLLQSTDISRNFMDKDTFFFERGQPDPEAEIFSMSFNMSDRIRVIGAATPDTTAIVKRTVKNFWRKGIQNERNYCGTFELKLAGNPWNSRGDDSVTAKLLLNHILAEFRASGFKLYGSVNTSIRFRNEEYPEVESWFFRKVGQIWQ